MAVNILNFEWVDECIDVIIMRFFLLSISFRKILRFLKIGVYLDIILDPVCTKDVKFKNSQ